MGNMESINHDECDMVMNSDESRSILRSLDSVLAEVYIGLRL